jgi:hypothetical protein
MAPPVWPARAAYYLCRPLISRLPRCRSVCRLPRSPLNAACHAARSMLPADAARCERRQPLQTQLHDDPQDEDSRLQHDSHGRPNAEIEPRDNATGPPSAHELAEVTYFNTLLKIVCNANGLIATSPATAYPPALMRRAPGVTGPPTAETI